MKASIKVLCKADSFKLVQLFRETERDAAPCGGASSDDVAAQVQNKPLIGACSQTRGRQALALLKLNYCLGVAVGHLGRLETLSKDATARSHDHHQG